MTVYSGHIVLITFIKAVGYYSVIDAKSLCKVTRFRSISTWWSIMKMSVSANNVLRQTWWTFKVDSPMCGSQIQDDWWLKQSDNTRIHKSVQDNSMQPIPQSAEELGLSQTSTWTCPPTRSYWLRSSKCLIIDNAVRSVTGLRSVWKKTSILI